MKEQNNKKIIWIALAVLAIALIIIYDNDDVSKRTDKEIISKYTNNEALVYVADKSTPPIRYLDEDDVFKGVVIDYLAQLSLELGTEIRAIPYSWDEAQEILKKGDANFADMFISEDRKKYFAFSDPIYYLRGAMAVRKNENNTVQNINSMKIAVGKGDFAIEYLKDNYPYAKVKVVEDVAQGIKLLAEGKVDGVVGDEPIVFYYINKLKKEKQCEIMDKAVYEEPVAIAVPKGQEELLPVLNRAIGRISQSNKLEQIQRKWFGISAPLIESKSKDYLFKWFFIFTSIAVVIFLIISYINRKLKSEVIERTKELQEANTEIEAIINDIPATIVVIDKDKKIRTTKIDNNNKIIDKVIDIYCVKDKENIVIESQWKEEDITKEVSLDGNYFIISAHPIKENSKETLITIIDITSSVVQRMTLLQSSKMLAIGQLAAGMAHEIRNPLGIIRTQGYLLNKQVTSERGKKSLKYIEENVNSANKIIDSVMNFWRETDIKDKEIKVKETIKNIIEINKSELGKKNIEINLYCDNNIWIIATEESLKHIIINLINNAADAMEKGGEINVNVIDDINNIKIIVEDKGEGISEENIKNIYNPFFSTKAPGKGTGLGLFIVYSEVEKLSGRIDVKSQLNKGTSFEIILPKGGIYEGKTKNFNC